MQKPVPPLYFGGSSDAGQDLAAEQVDKYLTWGEPVAAGRREAGTGAAPRRGAEAASCRFGIRLHFIVRETEDEAWEAADKLISRVTDAQIENAQQRFLKEMDSVGQRRMAELHGGRRDKLVVAPNLWAGVGLVRGGAGTALVGTPDQVAERIREYQAVGIDTIIGSGYPHLEEAYRVAELLFPKLGLGAARRSVGDRIANEFTVGHHGARRLQACLVMQRPGARIGRNGLGWALPALIIAGWELAARTGVIAPNVLPAPSAVVEAFWRLLLSGELVRNIGVSAGARLRRLRHRRLDRLRARPRQRPVGAVARR